MSEASLRAFRRWYSKPESKLLHAKRVKDWAKRHKPEKAASVRRWRKLRPEQNAWVVYKSGSKRRGIEFSLEKEHFLDLITDNCFYCTSSPDPINGVDRVDNSRGYVEDNVVTACAICNQAKHTLTKDAFDSWAIRLGDNIRKWSAT